MNSIQNSQAAHVTALQSHQHQYVLILIISHPHHHIAGDTISAQYGMELIHSSRSLHFGTSDLKRAPEIKRNTVRVSRIFQQWAYNTFYYRDGLRCTVD